MTGRKRFASFLWGVALALALLASLAFCSGLAGVFVYNRF